MFLVEYLVSFRNVTKQNKTSFILISNYNFSLLVSLYWFTSSGGSQSEKPARYFHRGECWTPSESFGKFYQTYFHAEKVVAGQNRSLWSVSWDVGTVLHIWRPNRERKAREWERERAGLPVRKVPCDYVFIWPWCRPHIPDASSNGWSSAHQNRLEDNERKCLSKTFVWKILTSPLCPTQTLFTFNLSFG